MGALSLLIPLVVLEAMIDGGLTLSYKYLIDRAILPQDGRALVLILGILVASVLTASLLSFWRDHRYATLASTLLSDIRTALFQRIQLLPFRYYESHPPAEILTRFSSDLVVVENWLTGALGTLVLPAAHLLVGIGLLFAFLPWPLAVLGIGAWLLVLIGPRYVVPRAAAAAHEKKESESRLLSIVSEIIFAQKIARIYGLEAFTRNRFERSLEPVTHDTRRAAWLGMLVERTTVAMMYCIQVIALAGGAWLAFQHRISLGAFVAFLTVFWNLGWTIVVLARSAPSMISAAGSARRIDELLEEDAGEAGGVTAPGPLQDAIRLENVHFGYPDRPGVLNDVSFEVGRGDFVAIVGGSGSGKSSALNLLIPSQTPDQGSVRVDGLDLKDADLRMWRSRIGFVLQDSILFNTTIRENIRLGRQDATDADVERAAHAADLHEAIMQWPDAYETVVGERGGLLSGGQMQRVSIARALIRDPDILLLDEATSALDPAAESAVNNTLRAAAQGRTTVSVTHRLASVTDASKIVVLQEGRIVETGQHEDLLARDGAYAGLWRKQAGFEISADGARADISLERLREVDVLRPLSLTQLEALASQFVCERVSGQQQVFRQGDPSDLFYIIARGTVRVSRSDPEAGGQDEIKVADLSQGDEFGEMGLLHDVPRNATVTAKSNCLLLTLTRQHFLNLLSDFPEVRKQVEELVAYRSQRGRAGQQ